MKESTLEYFLYQRYLNNTLASLYVINYHQNAINPEEWANDFILSITPKKGHPDILFIQLDKNETQYKVDSKNMSDFLRYIQFHPQELSRKLIFLFDAHQLSFILSHKLLKIFEELDLKISLFLMVPDQGQLLPTILSRAIQCKIKRPLIKGDISLKPNHNLGPIDYLTLIKELKDEAEEKKFIEERIEESLQNSSSSFESFLKLDQLVLALAENEKAHSFNNSKLSRLSRFFS